MCCMYRCLTCSTAHMAVHPRFQMHTHTAGPSTNLIVFVFFQHVRADQKPCMLACLLRAPALPPCRCQPLCPTPSVLPPVHMACRCTVPGSDMGKRTHAHRHGQLNACWLGGGTRQTTQHYAAGERGGKAGAHTLAEASMPACLSACTARCSQLLYLSSADSVCMCMAHPIPTNGLM